MDKNLTKRNTSPKSTNGHKTHPDSKQNQDESKMSTTWGRCDEATWLMSLGASFMMISTIILIQYVWASCTHFECSMIGPIDYILNSSNYADAIYYLLPKYSHRATILYILWVLFQALLYHYLPSMIGYG